MDLNKIQKLACIDITYNRVGDSFGFKSAVLGRKDQSPVEEENVDNTGFYG